MTSYCSICGHEAELGYEVFGFMPCCQDCFERIMLKQKLEEEAARKLEEQK